MTTTRSSRGPGTPGWTADFTDPNFRVRMTAIKSADGCNADVRVDELRGAGHYSVTHHHDDPTATTTTRSPTRTCRGPGSPASTASPNCFQADGADLNPRGFWGTLNTQGAENVNGDAYQPYYDTRPAGSARPARRRRPPRVLRPHQVLQLRDRDAAGLDRGYVYIYDPVFCDVNDRQGTGDRWFSGPTAVSTFYEVYDTEQHAVRPRADDIAASRRRAALFRNMAASDTTMGGSSGSECRYETDARTATAATTTTTGIC